jgi:hypothetical protein
MYNVKNHTEEDIICNKSKDIQSLGFKTEWTDSKEITYTKGDCLLVYNIYTNKIEIFDNSIKEKFKSVLFRGYIKDKSELKQLLNFLNIE